MNTSILDDLNKGVPSTSYFAGGGNLPEHWYFEENDSWVIKRIDDLYYIVNAYKDQRQILSHEDTEGPFVSFNETKKVLWKKIQEKMIFTATELYERFCKEKLSKVRYTASPIFVNLFQLSLPHLLAYHSDLGHDAINLSKASKGDVFIWSYRTTGTTLEKLRKDRNAVDLALFIESFNEKKLENKVFFIYVTELHINGCNEGLIIPAFGVKTKEQLAYFLKQEIAKLK